MRTHTTNKAKHKELTLTLIVFSFGYPIYPPKGLPQIEN